jgi:hypothetical protein
MLLTYRDSYKTLDDLNQDEMRLGGLRINPTTNISSTVTYMNNIKLRKINDKMKLRITCQPAHQQYLVVNKWEENCFSYYKFRRRTMVVDVAAKATQLTEDSQS